jgi:hypothetical protein
MTMRKISTGLVIAIAATGLFLTLLTAGMLKSDQTIPPEWPDRTIQSGGVIATVNIGAYLDSNCIQNATSTDWGFLRPGGNATKTVYIKNNGTVPVALTMTTESWQPTNASSLLTLTWNLENVVLNATKSSEAVLALSVSPDTGDLGDFSFDIIITGIEQAK